MLNPRILFIGSTLLFLTACSSFTPLIPDFQAKGKSLAVISGLQDGDNLLLAHYMTEALAQNSRYQVMSQKKIAALERDYPYTIQGPYTSAYFEADLDYTQTDVEKIKRLQKKLGVDYLYVLWTPTSVTHNGSMNSILVLGQLFEFPGAREVGRAEFSSNSIGKSCLVFQGPIKEDDIVLGMQRSTEYTSKELARETGMAK